MITLADISECVIKGDQKSIEYHVQSALKEGLPPSQLLNNGLLRGMEVVGERFRKEECFVPEVMVAARAMHAGLEILKPHLVQAGIKSSGTVVIGTVKGDIHDIGKSIVAMMLEGAGFGVVDLGVDVEPQRFVDELRQSGAQVLGMSALLTTTIPAMAYTIDLIKKSDIKDRVKVMVGGAPVTERAARDVGADAYGKNAVEAVSQAKRFFGLL